jgi:uncharacterized protein
MKAIRFTFFTFLTIFGILYLLYVTYIYFNQEEMVFRASKLSEKHQFSFSEKFEEVTIPSFDGTHLHGLLFKTPNPKGVVFYLHGNKGTVDDWGSSASIYTDLGYDIFYLDYRGFGKSEGEIENQEQIYNDISIAYDLVTSKYNSKETILIGYSIGTGLAAYLASIKNPKKLVLQAPYYNFLEYSTSRAPYFPDFLKKFDFETNRYIVKVKAPIYLFHGNQDGLISVSNSQRLKSIIKTTDSLFILDGEDHIGINDNSDFQQHLKQILR